MDRPTRELLARARIEDTILAYFQGLDRRDWEAVGACFAPDATANYDGRELGPGRDAIREFFAAGRHSELDPARTTLASSHVAANLRIQLDGDRAETETYVVAYLLRGAESGTADQVLVRGLRYLDRLREEAGVWLIARRVHTSDWMYEAAPVHARRREDRVVSFDQVTGAREG